MDSKVEETGLGKNTGSGGTAWWFRFLVWVLSTERWGGMSLSEDDSCEVTCQCGETLWVHSQSVYWCPRCHHGYRTKFETLRVPRWLYWLRKRAHIKPTRKYIDHLKHELDTDTLANESTREYIRKHIQELEEKLK